VTRVQGLLCAALKDHLATGDPPQVPLAGVAFWRAFAALCEGRSYHAHGPQCLDLDSIARQGVLMGLPWRAAHVEIIRALDRVWMAWAAKPHQRVLGPLTPEIFDAMF
jgi:hypothetical protein